MRPPFSIRSRSRLSGFSDLLFLNPLTPLFVQARHWIIDPSAPTAVSAAGGWLQLAPSIAIFVAICAVAVGRSSTARRRESRKSSSADAAVASAGTPDSGDTFHVACTTDAEYLPHSATMVHSLLDHQPRPPHIHLLLAPDVTRADEDRISTWITALGAQGVHRVDERRLEGVPHSIFPQLLVSGSAARGAGWYRPCPLSRLRRDRHGLAGAVDDGGPRGSPSRRRHQRAVHAGVDRPAFRRPRSSRRRCLLQRRRPADEPERVP